MLLPQRSMLLIRGDHRPHFSISSGALTRSRLPRGLMTLLTHLGWLEEGPVTTWSTTVDYTQTGPLLCPVCSPFHPTNLLGTKQMRGHQLFMFSVQNLPLDEAVTVAQPRGFAATFTPWPQAAIIVVVGRAWATTRADSCVGELVTWRKLCVGWVQVRL